MININQSGNENEDLKLSPLGTEEINSVIKSFKNSTFNQEELYKKDKKNFVRKTLFDLAKESERISSEESKSEIDLSEEETENLSQEVIKEPDEENDPDHTQSQNENNYKKENEENHFDKDIDKNIKSDEVLEKNIDQNVKDQNETILETDLAETNKVENVKDENQTIHDKKTIESNEIEYEEKTLEALDSVREAVTKSLEENIESQNGEINQNVDDPKVISNEVISEINLINTLFKNIREISNEEIENIVKSKVIELAEGVIGYKIEKFPDKFLKKIKNSINEIKSINNEIKIYLNDKDFELITKFVESHNTEINFQLDLDSSLGRGDFTIDMGGLIQTIKYKKVIE